MDLEQVDGDKMAVLDNLRAELPKTIFFLVSNSFDAEGIRLGQEHGAKGFIVKPFNTVRVLTSIRNAVVKFVTEMKQSQQTSDASSDIGD